ncbi:unnamed protein product [Sphenostylis stenocarpa]|uniref:Uncharacterized protein n=1 Tax=Sphenostylis stenocarpa TaxID=92480 RepID=A0AA86SU83_9FABA|nr:unnamed protein product [Sphenostylis stenocarpa]
MFNDPAVEIQELTVLIKNEITALNSALSDLQTIQNMDMAEGSYSQDRIVHSTAVCDDLKSKLMGATKHLQDVLTARTEFLVFRRIWLNKVEEGSDSVRQVGNSEFHFIRSQYETPFYVFAAAAVATWDGWHLTVTDISKAAVVTDIQASHFKFLSRLVLG